MENKLILSLLLLGGFLTGCYGGSDSSDPVEVNLANSGLVGVWVDDNYLESEYEQYTVFTSDGELKLYDYFGFVQGSYLNCYGSQVLGDSVEVVGNTFGYNTTITDVPTDYTYTIHGDELTVAIAPDSYFYDGDDGNTFIRSHLNISDFTPCIGESEL